MTKIKINSLKKIRQRKKKYEQNINNVDKTFNNNNKNDKKTISLIFN